MILLKLFWAFMKVGMFAFGGGYAAMPLIENAVIPSGWMTEKQFTDIITIAEMTPGPIAVNAATFVGTRVASDQLSDVLGVFAGPIGGIVATLGAIFPSLILVMLLAFLYTKYKKMAVIEGTLKTLRPAVISLIASSAITLTIMAFFHLPKDEINSVNQLDPVGIIIFGIALFVLRKFKLNPILVMIGAGFVGTVTYYILEFIK